MKTIFKEKQQFRQWWVWLLMAPLIIGTIYVIVQQLILGNPVGDNPLTDISVVFFSLFAFFIILFLWLLKLETHIDLKGVKMIYRPILRRYCDWSDIEKTEIINYGFVGYGFRWSLKQGWIYNVGGSMGLKVYLKNGKHFTIGTQKANDLKSFLHELKINYSSAAE